MPREILEWTAPQPGFCVLDGTAGGGGHVQCFLEAVTPGGHVVAVDRDPQAVERLRERFAHQDVTVVCASYDELAECGAVPGQGFDAALLDLGLSSDQLRDDERGFSYDATGPLDLRFNPSEGKPAWQWLAEATQQEIADCIYRYGEERFSRRIARHVVEQRRKRPIRTARDLATLVRSCVPRSRGHRIDPATRTFQALRIAVNDELGRLERALQRMPDWLRPGGRLAVLSFHSLEDRIVKLAFRDNDAWQVLTKKPIRPTPEEVQRNPRSRSARLRVAERPVAASQVGQRSNQ